MKMSSKVYDILKWSALVFLPAFGTLFGTLSEIWGIPFGAEIAKTIVAFEFFIGAIVGISNLQYKKNNQ